MALIGALFIHRLDGQLAAHLPASAAGHLSAAQVSSITPQGLAQLPAPLRHVIGSAFASALPPIYAYLIPLLAVAFLLALILKKIPLRTAARLDAAQALTGHPAPARRASARHGHRHPGTPRQPTRSDRKPRLRRVPAAGLTRPRASRLPARTCPNNPPTG